LPPKLVAVTNPNYWKADRAHVDEVEVLIIGDLTSRISALMTGEVHVAGRVDPQSAGLINSTPGVHVENHPAAGHRPLLMQADRPSFDRLDLRLAVKYALNREEILGLDRPAAVRYVEWLWNFAHGDLGQSLVSGRENIRFDRRPSA
jgi:ABC-type transport system substrate-binding protein